jgi:hypothetical protein
VAHRSQQRPSNRRGPARGGRYPARGAVHYGHGVRRRRDREPQGSGRA